MVEDYAVVEKSEQRKDDLGVREDIRKVLTSKEGRGRGKGRDIMVRLCRTASIRLGLDNRNILEI